MIGNDRFVQVFGSVPAGDDTLLTQIVANAVREGFHVVLCAPGTSTPVCTLPASKAKQDHECGVAHVLSLDELITVNPLDPWYLTDPNGEEFSPKDRAKVRAKVQAIINRVTKAHDGAKPNIGVIPGPSGYWVALSTENATVIQRSGFSYVYDWAWYTLPDGVRPSRQDMVMVPPSTVDGFQLRIIGQTSPAPTWLMDRITQNGTKES